MAKAYVYSYYLPSRGAKGRVVSRLTPMVGDHSGIEVQLSRVVQLWPTYNARGDLVEPTHQRWELYRSIEPGASYWDFPVEQIESIVSETTDPLSATILTSAWHDWLHNVLSSVQNLSMRNQSEPDAVITRTLNTWANEQSCYLP